MVKYRAPEFVDQNKLVRSTIKISLNLFVAEFIRGSGS